MITYALTVVMKTLKVIPPLMNYLPPLGTPSLLDLPIGIYILMNLRTHQGDSVCANAYAHGNYTNSLLIRDAWNTAYANLHRNYKLEFTLVTHQRVPTD